MNKKEAGKNRLWLHVGPAKTGTKTIQTTFAAHRSLLCRHGVLYPMPPSDGRYGKAKFHHHSIARALQECHVEYVRDFVATLDEAPDTVLSSEGFQKVSAHMFETLHETLSERFDVTAIY